MAKFKVYRTTTASCFAGEYEAETEREAEAMAIEKTKSDLPSLCPQCAKNIEFGGWFDSQVEESK